MKIQTTTKLVLFVVLSFTLLSCQKIVVITHGDLQLEFDQKLYSKVNSLSAETDAFNNVFQLSEFLETKNFRTDGFTLQDVIKSDLTDEDRIGSETLLIGELKNDAVCLTKIVSVKIYDKFPDFAVLDVSYVNCGQEDIQISKWVNNNYRIRVIDIAQGFWAFQGSSSADRGDWVSPISPGYYKKNFMGMNHSDYGGGIPVTDIWRKDGGIAVGHVELVPKEISLPLDFDKYSGFAKIGVEKEYNFHYNLVIGDTLHTLSTFVSTHTGDYFSTLRLFSEFMQSKGIQFVEPEEQAFESIWCGWGYERKFTTQDIIQTLPKVKELGIKWAVIDDGFQIAEGDWRVDTKRFPGGDKDMKKMVDAIHSNGLKAKLWWAPLAADPGSKILEESPEVLLINESGAPQYITWWDSYYMSPASEVTINHTKEVLEMFMRDWDFDGLKMDGQHMNAVPPEHNWERPLAYPEKSIEMLPEFFKMIYEEAREIKPKAVIENCPCGTCMSFYNMPFTNQTVSSDAESSWQLRHKGKTYKAIMPHIAYYGDHVENTESGDDFASAFGIGAVLGTKFTWPKDNPNVKKSYLLTPEKEKIWRKWFDLYHEKMLSKEAYLGELYDIGFDKPETHVIAKADTMFYAFYDESWKGTIELRGLEKGNEYAVFDYVKNTEIGTINGNDPQLKVDFNDHLLISVYKRSK